jgi:hypothetical protein
LHALTYVYYSIELVPDNEQLQGFLTEGQINVLGNVMASRGFADVLPVQL